MDTSIAVSIVVPVYREESNIGPFLRRVEQAMIPAGLEYEVLFCLDPSPDRTEQAIAEEIQRNARIRLLVFSRRFGQPAATMAGILASRGATCAVIDVDLQDPPELILHAGYAVINRLSDVDIPRNTGDFRIMSRRIVEELRGLNEGHGFLRGLVAYVGFKQDFVEYDRDERASGKGNYNRLTGSLKIGLNGLISFSSKPLQMMSVAGASIAAFSFL